MYEWHTMCKVPELGPSGRPGTTRAAIFGRGSIFGSVTSAQVHAFFAERAVGSEKFGADVEVEDHFVVGQLLDDRVGPSFTFCGALSLSGPRGKMASISTLVSGSFAPASTMAVTPAAICSEVLVLELLVPIISTASLGLMPSMLP